jgi:DNA-directed RNA polymerase specialized sigma24 family protein
VLRLAREEQLSLREVAERCGRSRESVKKIYARAVAQFAREFDRLQGKSGE